jgi:hypothetical protein
VGCLRALREAFRFGRISISTSRGQYHHRQGGCHEFALRRLDRLLDWHVDRVHTGHPLGYTFAILGFAASAAAWPTRFLRAGSLNATSHRRLGICGRSTRHCGDGRKPGIEKRDEQREAA